MKIRPLISEIASKSGELNILELRLIYPVSSTRACSRVYWLPLDRNEQESAMEIESWSYYTFILLTLLPVFLVFRLLQWVGWALFVNN